AHSHGHYKCWLALPRSPSPGDDLVSIFHNEHSAPPCQVDSSLFAHLPSTPLSTRDRRILDRKPWDPPCSSTRDDPSHPRGSKTMDTGPGSAHAQEDRSSLSGHVVLVTGATGGLGVSIASRLADEGAHVVVSDSDVDACNSIITSLTGGDALHTALPLDVCDDHDWQTAIDRIHARYGALHGCVNHAAIGGPTSLDTDRHDRWDRIITLGQTGVWLGMKHAGGLIEHSGGGSIVNICSTPGTVDGFGDSIAYHAVKGAIRAMTENAALHWADKGIRVNSLHPGFSPTQRALNLHPSSSRHHTA